MGCLVSEPIGISTALYSRHYSSYTSRSTASSHLRCAFNAELAAIRCRAETVQRVVIENTILGRFQNLEGSQKDAYSGVACRISILSLILHVLAAFLPLIFSTQDIVSYKHQYRRPPPIVGRTRVPGGYHVIRASTFPRWFQVYKC